MSNENCINEWASKIASNLSQNDVSFDASFIDRDGNRYAAVHPLTYVLLKNYKTDELCKIAVEFPAKVRRAMIPQNPTDDDIAKVKDRLRDQLNEFLRTWCKEQLEHNLDMSADLNS